jgi:hypothetical protein
VPRELTSAPYGPADRYGEWVLNDGQATERVFERARAHIAARNDERALRLLERTLPYHEPFRSHGWPAGEKFLARDCSASYHLLGLQALADRHYRKLLAAMEPHWRDRFFRWEMGLPDRPQPLMRANLPRRGGQRGRRRRVRSGPRKTRAPGSESSPPREVDLAGLVRLGASVHCWAHEQRRAGARRAALG